MQRDAQALRRLVQGSGPRDGVFSPKSVMGNRLASGEPRSKLLKVVWKPPKPRPGAAGDMQESDVYDPAHRLESDPVLTGTLQLLLITAWEANAESVCPGHANTSVCPGHANPK